MNLPTTLDLQRPNQIQLACPAGVEPATYGLEGRCSIQLSYGQMDYSILMDYCVCQGSFGMVG